MRAPTNPALSFAALVMVTCLAPQTGHALVSFGKVRVVDPIGQPTDIENDFDPRITSVGGGVWVAAWESDNTLGGTVGPDSDILFVRSTDDGATWSPPAALNTTAATDGGSDRDISVDLATGLSGVVIAVWQSDFIGGAAYARSLDGGLTWSSPVLIGVGGADSHLATDSAGVWLAVWRSGADLGGTIGSDDDILYSRSIDNGLTWFPVAVLNSDAATDGVKDDIMPQVAGDGSGTWAPLGGSAQELAYPLRLTTGQHGHLWCLPTCSTLNLPWSRRRPQ